MGNLATCIEILFGKTQVSQIFLSFLMRETWDALIEISWVYQDFSFFPSERNVSRAIWDFVSLLIFLFLSLWEKCESHLRLVSRAIFSHFHCERNVSRDDWDFFFLLFMQIMCFTSWFIFFSGEAWGLYTRKYFFQI